MSAAADRTAEPTERSRLRDAYVAMAGAGDEAYLSRLLDDYREDELPGWPAEALAGLFVQLKTMGADMGPEGSAVLAPAPLADAAGRPLDVLSLANPDMHFI